MKLIRVLQRAAEVLRCLESKPGSALADLHQQTGIPKPTLLRLLATLEHERLVARAMADGRYRSKVSMFKTSRADQRHIRLAELASPHLSALRRQVVWPSDLTVRQGYHMKLIETSRRESSLALHRDAIGFKVDILVSAVGRSYLAFCPELERERILAHLEAHPERYTRGARLNRQDLQRVLAQTRERGYGVRDSRFGGLGWLSEQNDDRLAAIAVPILSGPKVLACLTIVWPRRLHSEADIARRYLQALQHSAAAIAAAVSGTAQPKT